MARNLIGPSIELHSTGRVKLRGRARHEDKPLYLRNDPKYFLDHGHAVDALHSYALGYILTQPRMDHIIELGCADAVLLSLLGKKTETSRLTGVDIADEALEIAARRTRRERHTAQFSFRNRNVAMQPVQVPPQSVDSFVAILLLHLIEYNYGEAGVDYVLKQIHRKLKVSGRLIIADLHQHSGASVQRVTGQDRSAGVALEVEAHLLERRLQIQQYVRQDFAWWMRKIGSLFPFCDNITESLPLSSETERTCWGAVFVKR